jgi:hypothetical protein
MSFSSRAFLSKRVMRQCSNTEFTLLLKAAISRPCRCSVLWRCGLRCEQH